MEGRLFSKIFLPWWKVASNLSTRILNYPRWTKEYAHQLQLTISLLHSMESYRNHDIDISVHDSLWFIYCKFCIFNFGRLSEIENEWNLLCKCPTNVAYFYKIPFFVRNPKKFGKQAVFEGFPSMIGSGSKSFHDNSKLSQIIENIWTSAWTHNKIDSRSAIPQELWYWYMCAHLIMRHLFPAGNVQLWNVFRNRKMDGILYAYFQAMGIISIRITIPERY